MAEQSISDQWDTPQRVLVILAHPDDPEFFCGGTIARWIAAGHQVTYCLITCGDKGTKDRSLSAGELCRIRHAEQQAAADVLAVSKVLFLDYPDGYLVPDLNLRKDITRVIRQVRPDILVTCDPTTLYVRGVHLNHPDHRAAGQAVLDAVFPAARDHLYFPELFEVEQLEPHIVREVWVSLPKEPNVVLDVTPYWETKIRALYEHKSQIGEPEELAERMRSRHTPESTRENPCYVEQFYRIVMV